MQLFLTALRAMFVLLMAAIGWYYVVDVTRPLAGNTWLAMAIGLSVGVLAVCMDILLPPRRKLGLFAGTFFGVVVGVLAGYALSFVVQLVISQLTLGTTLKGEQIASITAFAQLLVYCTTTYFAISFVMQTKDDFRFIIPYVEFRKQSRGSRPILLDTSVLIDGRLISIAEAGVLDMQMILPGFVLQELQTVADSADRLKRARGRRGLDVMSKLQAQPGLDVTVYDTGSATSGESVDQQLMILARELDARMMTTDFNLQKVARLAGLDVININVLAAGLKQQALPGEQLNVRIIKPGEGANQGVGYMDDGTMVVVEQGREHLNENVTFTVTNSVQTNSGKMIFGRLADEAAGQD